MPKAMCSPVKWSAPGVVLTHCAAEGSGAEQLWKMPVDGGQPTALTAVNTLDNAPGFQGNYGNWKRLRNAKWHLPPHGWRVRHFVRVPPDAGRPHRKGDDPGLKDSADLAGVSGDKLVIVGQVGCGGGTSLVAYDPVANTRRAARSAHHQGWRHRQRPSLSEREVRHTMKRFTVLSAVATAFAVSVGMPATAQANSVPPCRTGQVVPKYGLEESALRSSRSSAEVRSWRPVISRAR